VSAALLLHVRARQRGKPGERSTISRELRDGWHAVRSRPWVWATIGAFSGALLLALAPFFVLGAAIGRDVYGSSAVYGIANVAWGLGTVTGAAVGSRWRPRYPIRLGLLLGMWWPASITVYAAGPPVAVMYAAMAVAGGGIGVFGVWWETALAERIPPHLLSRVSAWDWMGSLALLPLGYLLAGPAGRAYGESRVMLVGSLVALVLLGLALVPRSTWWLARIEEAAVPPPREPVARLPLGTA
jgi:hypothetical protein